MKRLIIIILALLLSLTLAACSEAIEANESTDNFSVQSSAVNIDTEQSFTAASGESTAEETSEETSTEESSEETSEVSEEPRLFRFELIASLNVGELIKYSNGSSGYVEGPQSYSVNANGEVFIMSAVKKEIICVNDKMVLETPNIYMRNDCVSYNRDVYILTYENKIYKYNMTEGLKETYDLPDNITPNEIRKLLCSGGLLSFDTEDGRAFILKDSEFEETISPINLEKSGDILKITVNGKAFSLDIASKSVDIIGFDDEGVYAYECVESDCDISGYRSYIKKYSYSGNVLGLEEIDQSEIVTYPLSDFVYAFDNLYYMKCGQETIDIYKVILDNFK
ncbi:MAG: hypothetical protein PHW77_07210 [Eubacteriales bacterium]|nr:hypothetical protein [Eubacteriales bacterium]